MHWSCGKCGGDINDDESSQRFVMVPESRALEDLEPITFDYLVKLDCVQVCPKCGSWSVDRHGVEHIECLVSIKDHTT